MELFAGNAFANYGQGTAGGGAPTTPQDYYAKNQEQYQNIMNGFKTQQDEAQANAGATAAGYNKLTQDVMGQLQGTQRSAQQDLANQYAGNVAGIQQNALGRGLGNSTVVDSLNRGADQTYNQGNLAIQSQYGQLLAGALGQYGSQALGYGAHANEGIQQLRSNQLGYMGQYQQGLQGQFNNAQQFGYQTALGNQNAQNQMALNQQQYNLSQAAARQDFGYQQQAADADLGRQNWYDTSGGGYAGAASGTMVDKPTMLMVGEGAAPEFVIPTDPQHRERAMKLWVEAGKKLGVKGMADGGSIYQKFYATPSNSIDQRTAPEPTEWQKQMTNRTPSQNRPGKYTNDPDMQ